VTKDGVEVLSDMPREIRVVGQLFRRIKI